MTTSDKIPPLLRGVLWIEALVLFSAGGALFFSPTWTVDQWAWGLTPFNTRFMGAIYLSAMAAIVVMAWVGRWSVVQQGLHTVFSFTLIVLIVSLAYNDRFGWDGWATWAWFALYIALPTIAAAALWMAHAGQPDAPATKLWRPILAGAALVLGVYGAGLLILPNTFSDLFPWAMDEFHSRLYSATFVAGAVGMAGLMRSASQIGFIAAGSTQALLGLLAMVGMVIVDAEVDRIDWTAWNTLGWIGLFAGLLILGSAMIIQRKGS